MAAANAVSLLDFDTYDCRFNSKSLECNAPSMNVGSHMDHADCRRFAGGLA